MDQMSELPMSPNAWCFLSPEYILLPHRDRSKRYCVALCKISPEHENGLEFLTLFHFPDEAVYNLSRSHVSVFSDPSPGVCPPGRPFFIDSERIVKIEWLVMDYSRRVEWVEIYIPARAFLSWADNHPPPVIVPPQFPIPSSSSSSPNTLFTPLTDREPHSPITVIDDLASEAEVQPEGETDWYGPDGMRHIAWEIWGPENSRMMWKIGADNEFQCFMFGTRTVSLSASSKITVRTFGGRRSGWGETIDLDKGVVGVLKRQRRASRLAEPSSPNDDVTLHWFPRSETTTTVFHQFGEAPDRQFTSSLPHHLARRDIGFTLRGIYSHGVMCDDEHIILVEVSDYVRIPESFACLTSL